MTARIHVRDLRLEVPHFVQPPKREGGWGVRLLDAITSRPHREFRTLLRDISFDVEDGQRLALLGRNGAGKTTLLRVLSGAFQPTSGVIEIEGSRQALLNLALGFNGDATLIENIYLRGTAMGLSTSRIRELVEQILLFAGLSKAAGHRLSTLSSGQRMRLGFAISTAIQHDIMLMDEWLGAGDARFLKKAQARMNHRVKGSSIVVLASHNAQLLKRVCTHGLVMHNGRMRFYGPIVDAVRHYQRHFAAAPPSKPAGAVAKATVQGKLA